MRVLITGGAGFIGSHLAEHWCERGDQVVVLDSLRSGMASNLSGLGVELVEGSVLDRGLLQRACEGVDLVFHLAAMVSVPESMEKPGECLDINVHGTLNLLAAARAQGVRKLIFSSTCAIYGDDPVLPKCESMMPRPRTPYAITKLDGELYLQLYLDEYGLATASLRYFNVFGPRQNPGSHYAAAVPAFIHRALRDEPLIIYGDGLQTRDFVFVKDVVAANVLAALSPEMTGVINVAQGQSTTVLQLAQEIVAAVGSRSPIRHAPERAGDIRHSAADVTRLRSFGFQGGTGLSQGLQTTIDYLRSLAGRQSTG